MRIEKLSDSPSKNDSQFISPWASIVCCLGTYLLHIGRLVLFVLLNYSSCQCFIPHLWARFVFPQRFHYFLALLLLKKSLSFPHNHTLNTFTILSVFVGINCDGLIIFVKPLKMKYRHTRHNLSCHLQWQRCWPVSALGIISFSSLNFSSRQATLHDLFLRFYWELNLGRTIIHLGRPTHIDHFSPESPHTNSIGIYANITLSLMYLTNIHWEDTTHWIKYKVIITVLLMPLTS